MPDEPFLGEVVFVGFSFPPKGWALCNGQLLPINQNQGLFALLGTTYGGDGRVNFALPDLRGRVPMHITDGHPQGQKAGTEAETVTVDHLPNHTHAVPATNDSSTAAVPSAGATVAAVSNTTFGPAYADITTPVALAAQSVTNAGASQPHMNIQPTLALNAIIALQGVFPSPI